VTNPALSDEELVALLQRYLRILQGHPQAERMMDEVLTTDFTTGFVGGHLWTGIDGLRDFLSQRSPFFDERHEVRELLSRSGGEGDEDVEAHTRLTFFLRSWEKPAPFSTEYTGDCFHAWRVRHTGGEWRVAAQLVERFADLNEPAERLFATPQEGLNT
jgi:hypothetical protein